MKPTLLRADARALPLPDASVDLIVTSPPYFALRSYTDGGEHYAGQIGSEATPQEFIAALIECTREMVRVLKPTGSIWVNLGDKYAGGGQGGHGGPSSAFKGTGRYDGSLREEYGRVKVAGRAKSLMLLPERYRIACVDELRLIARAVLIWSKPNGLPESVTDRVRRSHEDWVHLTKAPRYFAAVDEIREAHVEATRPGLMTWEERKARGEPTHGGQQGGFAFGAGFTRNPLGKLPGSVWSIPSQPLTVPAELGIDHFAAFPMEFPRRIILGWSPSGICVECGEGRRPMAERSAHGRTSTQARGGGNSRENGRPDFTHINRSAWQEGVTYALTGYACACAEPTAPTRPAVVLDPFGGTGTTALVASVLGRHGISVDRSADYCRLAAWRTTDAKQTERAQRPGKASVDMPTPQSPLDNLTGPSVRSNAMTTEQATEPDASTAGDAPSNTAKDVEEIRARALDLDARLVRVAAIAAHEAPPGENIPLIVGSVLSELVAAWREEAAWWAERKRRGWKSTSEELTRSAARLAGVAVGFEVRVSGPAIKPVSQPIPPAAPDCAHPESARSVLKSGAMKCTLCGSTIKPAVAHPDDVMAYLKGETDVYEPHPQPTILAAAPVSAPAAPLFVSPTAFEPATEVEPEPLNPVAALIMPQVPAIPAASIIENPFTNPTGPGSNRSATRLGFGGLSGLAIQARPGGMLALDHLSHSSVETYESCGVASLLRSASRSGQIGPERPSWSRIGGTAFHYAMESIENAVINVGGGALHGELGEPEEIWYTALERAISEVNEKLAGSPYEKVESWHVANSGREGYDWWRVEGVGMIKLYLDHRGDAWRQSHMIMRLPNMQPALEVPYQVTVQTMGGGVPVEGFIDQVWVNLEQGQTANTVTLDIIDAKTGKSAPTGEFQLREYASALRTMLPPDSVLAIRGAYWLARKGEFTPFVNLAATPESDAELGYRYGQVWAGRAAGVFAPHPTNMCSSCSLVDYCPTKGVPS